MSFAKFLLSRLTSSEMEVNGSSADKNGNSSREGGKSVNNNNDTSASGTGVSGNKSISGRRRFGENGFEEQGGYMAAKKAKLDNQFNTSTRAVSSENTDDELFKNISVYINGYTNPPEPELRELFIRHGGTFHPYHSMTNTTYVIATNLSAPSKRLYGSKTVKPDWIMDSIAAGKVLDVRDYKLYNFNEEKNQQTLSQFIRPKQTSATNSAPSVPITKSDDLKGIGNGGSDRISSDNSKPETLESSKEVVSDSDDDEDEFFECSQETIGTISLAKRLLHSAKSTDPSNKEIVMKDTHEAEATPSPSLIQQPSICESLIDLASDISITKTSPGKTGIKTATDEGFIEDFFGRSRLHLISEQKKEMQIFMANLRKDPNAQNFPNLKTFQQEIESRVGSNYDPSSFSDSNVVLMHIDLDCFFVSVGLLSRPHLRGKPVVVTHSTGKTQESRSDIACASYEARKFGVRNGMWVGEAKEVCPELEVIPYDFEEYRRISKLFFQAVASITLDVEPCSVDEMVVDVTSVLKKVPGASAEELANFFRRIILAETQCPASVGIGSNRLLAKLAVKLAKPDGVHYLKDCDAPSYIRSLQVRDLPGVGWSNEGKLRESFGVETCADLLNVPMKDLKSVFGEKTAEKIHSLCKGIDTAELKTGLDRPKSLSVDVNFGIRFQKEEDVTKFLNSICKELNTRAEKVQAVGTNFTLKLLIRKKGAGEPIKQGGHGIVDCISRSRKLLNPTRNWHELYKTACSLIRVMRFPPTDYRGVGVTLTDLTFECDKPNQKSVQRTLFDMPISSRAQKMFSLTQKKTKIIAPGPEKQNAITANIPDNNVIDSGDGNYAVNCDVMPSSNTKVLNIAAVASNSSNSNSNLEKQATVQTLAHPSTSSSSNQAPPVDINVLRQLPREIAEEQCQFYGISTALLDQVDESTGNCESENIESVDESFLLALPESVRQEILLQLQEANGSKKNVALQQEVQLDDQQPCSSKQALQRNRIVEEQQRDKLTENEKLNKPPPATSHFSDGVSSATLDPQQGLDDQVTPVISYASDKHGAGTFAKSINFQNPKDFWDITKDDCFELPPIKPVSMPALNNCTEIEEVRNMIRKGLDVVSDPTLEDAEHLGKYFKELVSNAWLHQARILLKFLLRRIQQLPNDSKWTPVLTQIVEECQKMCLELFHGAINLES